jgi:hypothetical protein
VGLGAGEPGRDVGRMETGLTSRPAESEAKGGPGLPGGAVLSRPPVSDLGSLGFLPRRPPGPVGA